jgi:transcription elongation factor GreA-like protein
MFDKNNHNQGDHESLEIPNRLRPEMSSDIYIIQSKLFNFSSRFERSLQFKKNFLLRYEDCIQHTNN